MAKKLGSGNFTQAEPWREGRIVAGEFQTAEVIPNVDSRKLNFTVDGRAVSVWETGVLKRFSDQFIVGHAYKIKCLGKTIETQHGMAWGFDVEELENADELRAAIREAANVSGH